MAKGSIKKAIAAFLLSLLTPGLGQVYNGQSSKALCCFLGVLGFLITSAAIGTMRSFRGLLFHFTFSLLIVLFIAGEAALTAIRQVRADQRPVHTWRSYLFGSSFLLLNAIIFGSSAIPEKMPGVKGQITSSDSMAPTVAKGDYFMADLRYYKSHLPQRGDVVIIRIPTNEVQSIKRVVAVGGDVIVVTGQNVVVNGARSVEPYAVYLPEDSSPRANSQGKFGPLTVPTNQVFVMGENRNNSYDSRHFGTVGVERIIAKPLYIYFSTDRARIGRAIH